MSGLAPAIPQQDEYANVKLMAAPTIRHGRPVKVEIMPDDGIPVVLAERARRPELPDDEERVTVQIETDEGLLELVGGGLDKGSDVTVSKYRLRGVEHYKIRPAGEPLQAAA